MSSCATTCIYRRYKIYASLKKTDELRLVKFRRPNDDEAYGHGWLREVLGVSSLGNDISEVK